MKHERWGSQLVEKKCEGEKDFTRDIMMIIIVENPVAQSPEMKGLEMTELKNSQHLIFQPVFLLLSNIPIKISCSDFGTNPSKPRC